MKHITFYFDVISPYAYLAFQQLPHALRGISCNVTYRPVLLAGVLAHYGQLCPAEIAPKREWTYRHVQWLANSANIPLQMPLGHPFSPLALLRLALAAQPLLCGEVNRFVCESIFKHVWCSGLEAYDAQRFDALVQQLRPACNFQSIDVKNSLKVNTALAISQGVFGVPSFAVANKMFRGLDALPMLRSCLLGDEWFAGSAWQAASQVSVGACRNRL